MNNSSLAVPELRQDRIELTQSQTCRLILPNEWLLRRAGLRLVETSPPHSPLADPVRIQLIETVVSAEPAINLPEYHADGGPSEGLAADQQGALLAQAVFSIFKQELIDSGKLNVGDSYFLKELINKQPN